MYGFVPSDVPAQITILASDDPLLFCCAHDISVSKKEEF